MPFDPISPDNPVARRQRLILALRQTMPDNFVWSFGEWSSRHACGTVGCACGLAKALGISKTAEVREVATALGISVADAKKIFNPDFSFFGTHLKGYWPARNHDAVTPAMVADRLERLG